MRYLIPLFFPLMVLADSQTTGNLITNGNFNNGTTGWTLSGDSQRIGDCCPGGHDLEFGDSGSIEQSFDLLSNTITQPMLNNGITLNSSVEVQNGECGVSGCWGGSGAADTFTIRLQIKDINNNVLSVTTQERTNVTGINGKDFTDSVSFSGTGSNQGNIFISGSDGNSPANLGGPNVDNIFVTMTYDDTVLSATESAIIATAFEEIEEVLSTEIETVEFIPIEEFTFEVYEEPVVQMFEEIYIEEIAKEEINIGTINVFKEIPMEVAYEEPTTIETFSTKIQSFEENIETTESFNNTPTGEIIQEIFSEEVYETQNVETIVEREPVREETSIGSSTVVAERPEENSSIETETRASNEPTPKENEERVSTESNSPSETNTAEASSNETATENSSVSSESETVSNSNSTENTTVAEEEVTDETVGETETGGSESGNGGTETVAEGEETLEGRDTEVEESRAEGNTRADTQTISIESIEKKVNETLKRVDQRLIATSLIVARAMESPLSMDNYGQINNNIFINQLNIDGGSYDDQREYIDLRDIYAENQIAYSDPMATSQKILQESIDNRIRAEEHLKRIRGY